MVDILGEALASQAADSGPLAQYQKDLARDGFVCDEAQQQAISLLQELYLKLVAPEPKVGFLKKIFGSSETQVPIQGLYFWGGVGRGKTYLMDIFYDSLPFEKKLRLHFHRFMRRVHRELKEFKGEVDPLEKIAEKIASEARVICFDEFFVTDITDAMILANLLRGLFNRGVTLVTTSNIVPDGLYKDGLQRSQFLPAIDLLNNHTKVVNVDGGVDYRLRALERIELFHSPLDEHADELMDENFLKLVPDHNEIEREVALEVEGRNIQTIAIGEDVVWFDFYGICDGPRSQNDYIEIAREFHSVLISRVPSFNKQDDLARRFVNLVDEFYDRHVNLILSAEAPLESLYVDGRLSFEFQRTQSRLLEMQSKEYLAKEHRA